jgi:hypothetical protein|tara:strand:- start:493 stop:744 length:252 start_codon:yes stop_codon:yes gene_type:complete
MAKSKNFKPTRREIQQTIGLMIKKIQYLEESLSGVLGMLEHYINMKGDTEKYKEYLEKQLRENEKIPLEDLDKEKDEKTQVSK